MCCRGTDTYPATVKDMRRNTRNTLHEKPAFLWFPPNPRLCYHRPPLLHFITERKDMCRSRTHDYTGCGHFLLIDHLEF